MAITDPAAIRYSDEQFRQASDRLARVYYRAHELRDAWNALTGTNDQRLALLLPTIRSTATLIANAFRFVFWADRLWQSGTMSALFPNDAAELVFDNFDGTAQDPSRPPITGQDLRRLKFRMEEFGNWITRGTDADKHWVTDLNATLPITYSYFDQIARISHEGSKVPTGAWGRVLAVDRCGDIVTQLETTVPANLDHILRVSVNPREA